MVDRLRSAAEQLEAPICPDCHVEMKWFRSELLADEPTPIIAHLFVCPHCKRAAKVDTVFRGGQAPPESCLRRALSPVLRNQTLPGRPDSNSGWRSRRL